MSGESSHASRQMGFHIVYEVGSGTYVRRSGTWVKNDAVQVRRSAAWADAGLTSTSGAAGVGQGVTQGGPRRPRFPAIACPHAEIGSESGPE